jgi:thiamine-triphosphatase
MSLSVALPPRTSRRLKKEEDPAAAARTNNGAHPCCGQARLSQVVVLVPWFRGLVVCTFQTRRLSCHDRIMDGFFLFLPHCIAFLLACMALLADKGSKLARTSWVRTMAVAFVASRCSNSSVFSSDPRTTSGTGMVAIEVEEKFTMSSASPQVLEDLGFALRSKTPVVMTDWYFDDDNFSLLRRDCWLRHRALVSASTDETRTTTTRTHGSWQLKVGSGGSGSRTTVYTEIEGREAVLEALSNLDSFKGKAPNLPEALLSDRTTPTTSMLPNSSLTAFARIGTFRSSWTRTDELFRSINIDLDSTDFGYAVGEVEIEVSDPALVERVRERVQEVVRAISGPPKEGEKTMGKLEYYLVHQRPDVYQIAVECNVI